MRFRSLTIMRVWLLSFGLGIAMLMLSASNAMAIIIVGGGPVTTAPSYVDATIGQNQFLLPIEVKGAAGLQNWGFDLSFDANVVQLVDLGGITSFFGVYAAEFNDTEPVLSSILSSGFPLGGLQGVAGFSSDVAGDGLLAFIGFEYLPGQNGQDPGFEVGGVNVTQSVPEPTTAVLLAAGLLMLVRSRRLHTAGKHGTFVNQGCQHA